MLDEVQQRLNIDRHSTQSGLTSVPLLAGGALSRWKDSRHYQNVISIYREADVDKALVPEGVRAAIEQYTALMHEQRYLDYTMIMSEPWPNWKPARRCGSTSPARCATSSWTSTKT